MSAEGSEPAPGELRSPARGHAPPPCPPGWLVAPPDFVGVGVHKAGTTWWHDLVADHPGVHRPVGLPKELHYFDRFWLDAAGDAELAGYAEWFPRPPGLLAGEWTPRYLHDVWTPPLLARAAPGARFLVLLRDPLERFRSGRGQEVRSRRPDPMVGGESYQRGRYGEQLARLFELVDRERVLVLQHELCRERPAEQLARTYRFLGLDDAHRPADLISPRNASGEVPPLAPALVAELVHRYRADLELLATLVPDLDLERWPTWTGRADGSGAQRVR